MKKLCLFIICALLPGIALPQYLSKEFTIDDTDATNSVALNVSVSNRDSVVLLGDSRIASGMFVSGCANLSNEDESYVRITVRDTYNSDYLVYELYPLLAETQVCPFSKVGLETAYLDNIQVQSIKIETQNASVTLDSVFFVVPERSSRNMRKATLNRKTQCEHIASRLNDRLVSGNKTWRAGLTFISQMTFEEKKGMFGGKVPVLYGFDYYKGGVFVMPGFYQDIARIGNTRDADNYVTEWDWRNRHGKNWVTSVKDQNDPVNCGSCWAFSALGTFESYINLYYNQLINYDLSEQEIISYGSAGDCSGGYLYGALNRLIHPGAIHEDCFPYCACDNILYNPYSICDNPDRISIGGYSYAYTTDEDSIKRMLFKNPICFGIKNWGKHGHFVVLVGYKQIQNGEYFFTSESDSITISISQDNPLVGHPAWLIKNSVGTDWGDNGFGYVAMPLSEAYEIYKLSGNVKSEQHMLIDDYDIVCEDADGDGYFNWGIKDTIFSLPIWSSYEEDGDDSDCTKGPIDEFGKLREINPDSLETIIIDSNEKYDSPRHLLQHIVVGDGYGNNVDFTISSYVYCCPGVTITLERGAYLYLEEGAVLENVILNPQPGSHIVIKDGSRIKHNKAVKFQMPIGVTLEQNHGTIE